MFDRLEDTLVRFEELLSMLSEPDVANDPKRFQKLMKEQADLAPIVEAYKEYKENKQNIEDSLAMLQEESDEELRELAKEELELGYRTSVIAKKGYIVLEAVLELQKGEKEKIQAVMDDLKERRVTKQPLEYPSAGSTFKRPEGYFAGKLIQDAGLRGFQVGGAQVSEKHCGFVINKDQATASDVMNLMNQVSDKVYEEFGVRLQPEVKRLGVF